MATFNVFVFTYEYVLSNCPNNGVMGLLLKMLQSLWPLIDITQVIPEDNEETVQDPM